MLTVASYAQKSKLEDVTGAETPTKYDRFNGGVVVYAVDVHPFQVDLNSFWDKHWNFSSDFI